MTWIGRIIGVLLLIGVNYGLSQWLLVPSARVAGRIAQNQETQGAELRHLRDRVNEGSFGRLQVDELSTDNLIISTDEGKLRFLKSLSLSEIQPGGFILPGATSSSTFFSRQGLTAQSLGFGLVPSGLTGCPICVNLQAQSPGQPQLGHVSIAGVGIFGSGVVSGGGVAATGTIAGSGDLNIAGNAAIGGRVGIGTGTPKVALDVDNQIPQNEVSAVSTGAYPFAIKLKNHYAFVTNFYNNKLQIFDYSDPSSPKLAGSVATGLNPADVELAGNYAFVSNLSDGNVQVFDIRQERHPASVSTVATGTYPAGMAIQGRYLYVLTYGGYKLEVIDIGNPAHPVVIGSTSTYGTGPLQVVVKGSYAYITTQGGTMEIYDISNPKLPIRMGFAISNGSQPSGLEVGPRYAYMLNSASATMDTIDISDPNNPVVVNSVQTGAQPVQVKLVSHYLYVTSATHLLEVFDVTNPMVPQGIAALPAGSSAGVALDGRYIYLTDITNNQIHVYDGGGAHLQQFTAGLGSVDGLQIGSNLEVTNDAVVHGGLQVGQGISVYGDAAFDGAGLFSGRLGIGTTSPGGKLHIQSGAVDEVGQIIQAMSGQTADLLQAQDDTGAILARLDVAGNLTVRDALVTGTLTVNGHIVTGGTTPTLGVQAAAGVGATGTISGNDTLGTVSLTAGSGGASGRVAHVAFASAFGGTPRLLLTPDSAASAGLQCYQFAISATGFDIGCSGAPTSGTTYAFNYFVGQ